LCLRHREVARLAYRAWAAKKKSLPSSGVV
jgi:hypothetical protein